MLTGYIDITELRLQSATKQQLLKAQLLLGNMNPAVNISPNQQKYLLCPGGIGSKIISAEDTLTVFHLSPGSHLQINVSDPFDDTMRRPNQWIHILVLTLYPTGLQGLEVKHVDITLKYFLPHIWSWKIFWIHVLFSPPCRTGAVGAVRCQAAG